jgi:hypothetical protein
VPAAKPRRGRDGQPIAPEQPIDSIVLLNRAGGLAPLPVRVVGCTYTAASGGWNYVLETAGGARIGNGPITVPAS